MSKIALSPSASGTGTLTISAPNTDSDRTLTLPDNSGTLLSNASDVTQRGVPAFSAYNIGMSPRQSISTDTYTKVVLPTEEFDTNGFFDPTTNYRFQPTIAGYYLMIGSIYSTATTGATRTIGAFFKNGSNYWRFYDVAYASTTGEIAASGSKLIYMNGSTDYIELYAYVVGTGTIYVNSASTTSTSRLEGILVRAA